MTRLAAGANVLVNWRGGARPKEPNKLRFMGLGGRLHELQKSLDDSRIATLSALMPPRPKPCILDDFDYIGFVYGSQRWSSDDGKRLYTWDNLHGEVEVFSRRGKHLGVKDAVTGDWIKESVKGRTIDV